MFRELSRLFCAGVTALAAAELTGPNCNTVNQYYGMLRRRIAEICEADSPFEGEVEADESHFGARCVRGVRGRGARGKTIVFGLLKRRRKVYTQIVPDVSRRTLMQVIEGKVEKSSGMYTDGFGFYDGLVDWGHRHHYLVRHGENEFVEGDSPATTSTG